MDGGTPLFDTRVEQRIIPQGEVRKGELSTF